MKAGISLRRIQAALHQYGRVVEIDGVVKRLRVSIVIHDFETLTDGSGFQLFVFYCNAYLQGFIITLRRVGCVNFERSCRRPRNWVHCWYSIWSVSHNRLPLRSSQLYWSRGGLRS